MITKTINKLKFKLSCRHTCTCTIKKMSSLSSNFMQMTLQKKHKTEKNHFPDSKDNTIFIFLKFVHIVIAAVEANYY